MSVPRSVLARVTQRLLTRIPSTLAGLCLLPWEWCRLTPNECISGEKGSVKRLAC